MDSGGQFTQLYKWVPGYGQWWSVQLSCINEYLAMDSGGQFTQLYKWVLAMDSMESSQLIYEYWWTVVDTQL